MPDRWLHGLSVLLFLVALAFFLRIAWPILGSGWRIFTRRKQVRAKWIRTCKHCHQSYDLAASDADRITQYCSARCEVQAIGPGHDFDAMQ